VRHAREYKTQRAKGLKTSAVFLRTTMRRAVAEYYGERAAAHFKASNTWLRDWCSYYSVSIRRSQNYADTGEKRVWIAGTKQDLGKRFCTLQVAARCANGYPSKPRHGQPKLTIIFRGQGTQPTQCPPTP